MIVLFAVLLLLSALCFAGAAFGVAPHPRVSLLALGLLLWLLVPLIQTFQVVVK